MNDDDQTNGCVTAMVRGIVVFLYLIQSLLFLGIAQYFVFAPALGLRRLWLLPATGFLILSFLGVRQVLQQVPRQRLASVLLMTSAPLGWFLFWGPVGYFYGKLLMRMKFLVGMATDKGVGNFVVELFLAIGASAICALLFLPKQECSSTRHSLSRAVRFLAAFLIGALIALMTPSFGGD